MKRQSQLDAVVTSAAVVSADVARAQVTPVVRLVYSVDETSTSQGTDWIQTIRIANSGGPIHDLTFEAYSFWEVGFGPCRADADLVYLPAFEPWFDLRDQPVSPKGDVVITGIPSLLPGQSMNSESDWLYRGDPEQRLFCRPWVYAEVSYVDSLGDAHDDWFVLTSFGPERIDAPNANLLQQLDHLKEAGLEVGSYTDTVDTVHAVIAKARATESDALDAIAKGMQ